VVAVSTTSGRQRVIRRYAGAVKFGRAERDWGYSLSCIRCTRQGCDAFWFPCLCRYCCGATDF